MDRLPDKLDSNARLEVRVNGVVVGTRRIVDFEGAITATDDGTNDVVTLTFTDGDGNPIVNYWKVDVDNNLVVDIAATGPIGEVFITNNDGEDNYVAINKDNTVVSGKGTNILAEDGDLGLTATGAVILTGDTITFSPTLDSLLADTGVAAGTYGTPVRIPRFTVNAKGRITAVEELTIPPSGLTFWKFASDTLQNDTATTPGIEDINLAPQGLTGDTYIKLFDDGSGDGFININAEQGDGDINVTTSRDWNQNAARDINVWATNNLNLRGDNSASIYGLGFVTVKSDNDVTVTSTDGGDITVETTVDGGGDIHLIVDNGNIIMPNLPTSDPSVSGALYVLDGVLMVSP